ncbi:protein APCDD1-like [Dreissena polymorpha]|uniref:APCDD1 domain-containing protein n=1 Tax=Dreissena polymorpha TaxID=45954 RepID=A0A9D3Z663_DREPO|nr:protein APCDD1-like [Dreissena polymorpha]KAH3710939.1 hypothetical protein DPMN_070437 [Dreissena polymorpha]
MGAELILILLSVIGCLSTQAIKSRDLHHAPWAEDDCRRTLRESLAVSVNARTPPKFNGKWTSSGCENRPGPEFVIRKYAFRKSGFTAQLFYYADEDCSHVTHYVNARGTVRLVHESWRTPGGFEFRYQLTEVQIIPYTDTKAKEFGKLMRRYCSESSVNSVKTFRKFDIFKFPRKRNAREDGGATAEDFDCTKLFNFTMNEIQLIRVERRIEKSISGAVTRRELHLGDVSTDVTQRRQYVPTHYQAPLVKPWVQGCDVCRMISQASHRHPPVLPRRQHSAVALPGEWISQRCETRPNGQFLTRHLSFLGWRSFQGMYEFFRDPLCKESSYSIAIKGTYARTGASAAIPSASEFVFKTTKLKITPNDYQMLMFMNSYSGSKCGDAGSWKLGVTQDVTSTDGCVLLGITLPHVEHEIVKTEYDNSKSYLYTGQRPSDFVSMAISKNRPTSFQMPMIKCGGDNLIVEEVLPLFEQYSGNINSDSAVVEITGNSSAYRHHATSVLLFVALLSHCVLVGH